MNIKVNEKGFSMVELLISVVILALGILGLIGMQVAAINGNLSANEMTTAVTLAQDQIEQLKRLAVDDDLLENVNTGNDTTLTSPTSTSSFDQSTNYGYPINDSGGTTGLCRYRRFWNVADDTPTTGAKTVVVFVFWGAAQGTNLPQHRVMVQTIIGG